MSRIIFSGLLLTLAVASTTHSAAHACGMDSDCLIGERTYRINMPEGYDGTSKVGALIFNHGYRGTAAGLMRNKRLRGVISKMGLAFVAPKSARQDWDIPNAPSDGPREELPFFDKLKDDLVNNHNIDGDKIVVSGFSAGGMMTWNLACERGSEFAAFIPIAGTFWAPVPDSCPTLPVNLIHIHGTADKIVPMKGRRIAQTRQGNVRKALELATSQSGFAPWKDAQQHDGLSCEQRKNGEGQLVKLCLHSGGHSFKSSWLPYAWSVFEKAGVFN